MLADNSLCYSAEDSLDLYVVGTVAVASVGVASVTVGKEAVKKMGSEGWLNL